MPSVLLETLTTARDLGRLHEIAAVLIRHGLGDTVRRLGLAGLLEQAGRALHWKGAEQLGREPEVRLREAFEALGPTFVKLGQVLAGRPDLLPPAWTEELSRLHEHATAVPIEEIRAQLVEDLGDEPEALFAAFDPEPLAAASIAQVHRATLRDGTAVVLKIRRPGIREVVEADLRLIARIAELAEAELPELRRFRPRGLVRRFSSSLRNELDLRLEAKNAVRLASNLAPDALLVVPRMFPVWTRERLCVMEYLEGPSLGDWVRAGKQDGASGPGLAARIAAVGADAVLRSVLVDGCFHADPHPGNLILLADGRVGLIDFGMVGFLSATRRREFLDILQAVVTRDTDLAVSVLLGWTDADVDTDLLAQDCAGFIDRYHGLPLSEFDTAELLGDLLSLVRENDLFLPSDVAMLLKVFLSLDGLGRLLDPNFVMAKHLEPFARAAWREQHSPLTVVRRGMRGFGALLQTLPGDLKQLARQTRRGRVHLELDVEGLDRLTQRIDRSVSRLTVGLITAALIVGTAISLTVPGGPTVAGLPLFGFLGFTSSLAAGLWVLWSVLRSGRR